MVFNVILCCTAVTFNSVTIYALRKTPSVPMPLKVLLLNLAVSDLGVGILCHPLYIVRLVVDLEQSDTASPTFYSVYWFVTSVFTCASFFGVLSLSVDRFLALSYSPQVQATCDSKTCHDSGDFVLGLDWRQVCVTLAAKISSPRQIPGGCNHLRNLLCGFGYSNQIQSMQVHGNAQENAPDVANSRRMRKSAFTTIYVYLLFLLCYLPNISLWWFVISGPSLVEKIVRSYTITLLLLNSSLNPLIYCWKMRDIRQTIRNMMQNAFVARN